MEMTEEILNMKPLHYNTKGEDINVMTDAS